MQLLCGSTLLPCGGTLLLVEIHCYFAHIHCLKLTLQLWITQVSQTLIR